MLAGDADLSPESRSLIDRLLDVPLNLMGSDRNEYFEHQQYHPTPTLRYYKNSLQTLTYFQSITPETS